MLRTALSRAAQLGAGVGVGGFGYLYATDEGTRRACTLYGKLGPVVVHYRFVEARQQFLKTPEEVAEREWRALDRKYAAAVVGELEQLQGMYTKYGQIASGMNNTFSTIWIEQLRKLEDKVPPRPKEVVMRTILEETGKPASETFSEFDDAPLGSASIGQVHRAVLRADGSEVAVKVQYPEAKGLFRTDMQTIKGFMKVAAPEQLVTLGELERQFEQEFDYRQEAANLREVGANMRRHGFAPREVTVPAPRTELCTERLLVMELVPGCKLLDGLRKYAAVIAAAEGQTLEEFEAAARAKIEKEGMPSRYAGPSAAQINAYLALVRWRDRALNALLFVFNLSPLRLLLGPLGYRWTTLPPNAPRLMDTLMRVMGTQLLVDGVFNADTHAGNFLMMPDDRIALIDFGSTKRLTQNERVMACVMYAALGRGDDEMLVRLALAGGYKSKHMNKEVIAKLIKFGNDTMGRELLGDKNAQQFIDDLRAEDPYEEVADNFVMSTFMSIRMRVVGLALNHPIVCSDWWAKIADAELRRLGLPYHKWDDALIAEYAKDANVIRERDV